ncbi:12240_t:CDS:2 [Dentiscutata heterogama]|uniref:12240_t:CDS:1 n=1 Tax=Dentiscutata heterogama TaxID=1316150 RepID=A0ACA9K7I1_9GLOM|nr:12240_t:CDS:2 [Dentiscutata heterogama]
MPASVTVLCYVTSYQKKLVPNKSLSIVKALGIVRSQSLDFPLNIILTGFYHHDTIQELNLPEFEDKDVVLATEHFRIIEGTSQNDEKYSILKITLNDVVRFDTLDSNDLSAFPILINMTALVQEDPEIDNEDVVINVLTKNYVDQGYNSLKLTCYHPTSAQYLTNTTAVIKKDSVIYVNGELMITDDDNIIHIRNESKDRNNTNQQNAFTVAQTIATRVKGSTRCKKTTPNPKPYLKTNSCPKVTDLANNLLNKPSNSNTPNQTVTE